MGNISCEIDNNDRELLIRYTSEAEPPIGVYGDVSVNVISFKMGRKYCDSDLKDFQIRISYRNAEGQTSYSVAENIKYDDDSLYFDWVVPPLATAYAGETEFAVNLYSIDANLKIDRAFNTSIASLTVLRGLNADEVLNTVDVYDTVSQISKDVKNEIDIYPSRIELIDTVTLTEETDSIEITDISLRYAYLVLKSVGGSTNGDASRVEVNVMGDLRFYTHDSTLGKVGETYYSLVYIDVSPSGCMYAEYSEPTLTDETGGVLHVVPRIVTIEDAECITRISLDVDDSLSFSPKFGVNTVVEIYGVKVS